MRGLSRKMIFALGLAAAGLGLCVGAALAHGVGWRRAAFPAVGLEFLYSTGEAMSYREARAFSPADEKFAHQTGRTDAAGRFAFIPDAPGPWRVVVRDEEGHQAVAELEVTAAMLEGGAEAPAGEGVLPGGLDLALRAGLGVSLLFNIAAFVSLSWSRGRGA